MLGEIEFQSEQWLSDNPTEPNWIVRRKWTVNHSGQSSTKVYALQQSEEYPWTMLQLK